MIQQFVDKYKKYTYDKEKYDKVASELCVSGSQAAKFAKKNKEMGPNCVLGAMSPFDSLVTMLDRCDTKQVQEQDILTVTINNPFRYEDSITECNNMVLKFSIVDKNPRLVSINNDAIRALCEVYFMSLM